VAAVSNGQNWTAPPTTRVKKNLVFGERRTDKDTSKKRIKLEKIGKFWYFLFNNDNSTT
jgi:hypothetical protein